MDDNFNLKPVLSLLRRFFCEGKLRPTHLPRWVTGTVAILALVYILGASGSKFQKIVQSFRMLMNFDGLGVEVAVLFCLRFYRVRGSPGVIEGRGSKRASRSVATSGAPACTSGLSGEVA